MLEKISPKLFYIMDNFCPPRSFNCKQVNTHLFRGSGITPDNYPQLANAGIEKVVSLQNLSDSAVKYSSSKAKECGMEYFNCSLDPWKLPESIPKLVEIFKDSKVKLVHCFNGEHRTGLGVALERFLEEGIPMEKAIQDLNSRLNSFYRFLLASSEKYLLNFAKSNSSLTKN